MRFSRSFLLLTSLGGAALFSHARADEGMWTFDHLPMKAMKATYGFSPSAEWINHVVQSSARLAEGCSASFVSGDGLVMTNHHCANSCLSALSDKQHDYFRDGFYSKSLKEERQCPGMELDRLDGMTDVSDTVQSATDGKTGAAYAKAMQAVESRLTQDCVKGDAEHWRCDMVSLYHGGMTALYKYRRYKDVRVVMAPEQGIAFFGGDPDNFSYPRYDIDLSVLRVYQDGKPVHTPFLKVDPAGPKAGELVFTSGNPGSTQRGLPAEALAFQRDTLNPAVIGMLSVMEGALWAYSREGAEQAKEAENTLFGVQNSLKSYSGTQAALQSGDIVAQRRKDDAALQAWIDADARRAKSYGKPFKAVADAVTLEKSLFRQNIGLSMALRGLTGEAMTIVYGAYERTKPDAERKAGYHDAQLGEIAAQLGAHTPFYPKLQQMMIALGLTSMRQTVGEDNALVKAALGKKSPDDVAAALINGTKLGDPAARLALWKGGEKAVEASTDPLIVYARKLYPAYAALHEKMDDEVRAPLHKAEGDIARARFAKAKTEGKLDSVYPDATFSPRLSIGTVRGWKQDGKDIPPFTDFAGMYAHATGSEPFRLPKRWMDAKAAVKPGTHVDFVSTNDIVGGNSGSPVIDREGHAVGLIFDGNLPSLAGDLYYDIGSNRAVATDTSAIIAALRDVYKEPALADEMTQGHR